jgi:hypothetical protein
MRLRLRLYTRPGCHLCEQAEDELARLRLRHPHTLERVDISSDAGLMRDYGERIPVLSLSGREYAAPLSPQLLERALADAEAEAEPHAEAKPG